MTHPDHAPIDPDRGAARPLTRRDLLAVLGIGAAGAALGSVAVPRVLGAAGLRVTPPDAPPAGSAEAAAGRVAPFDLADVRLLDGPFRDAQRRDARYLLALEPDRLLHNFRANAGLTPKAPVYGGWESQEPWVEIRCHGHTLGHYLSAVAMMSAATGDRRFKERSDYIAAELRACQDAAGTGLVCAFPDGARPLADSLAGRPFPGVPWYTMHKVFAGLRDAHRYAASPDALPVLARLAEWTQRATADVSDARLQQVLEREHGGMNEVLADVAVLTNDRRFLALAERFSHRAILDPLAEGRDALDGLHANTQIPKVIGFERLAELTGKPAYAHASRVFWQTVVANRSFVTGGHGDAEHFFPPAEFARHLGSGKTMETCCTHNMLRLTRALFAAEPRAAYADYYERALYNGILASQDPDTGMMTYFQSTRPGYRKLYHTPTESFWCCTGSGMENHAKYGDAIYFRGADALYVNLFIPSTVAWRERGLTVTQATRFPEADATRLTIAARRPVRATLHVRHPAWCEGLTITVNGRAWPSAGAPGRYVPVAREWRDGDVVEVRLPMRLRAEPLPGAPDLVAFVYGPVVLAGRLGGALPAGADLIRNERTSGDVLNAPADRPEVPALAGDPRTIAAGIRAVAGAPLTFATAGLGRPRDVTLAPYYRVAHERYTLYWRVVPA